MKKNKSLYQLEWKQYSKEDYEQLDGSQKIFVNKAPDRIRVRGMEAGHPLQGNLSQCNKLNNKKMGLRIIFKEAEGTIQVIQKWLLGNAIKKRFIRWLKID